MHEQEEEWKMRKYGEKPRRNKLDDNADKDERGKEPKEIKCILSLVVWHHRRSIPHPFQFTICQYVLEYNEQLRNHVSVTESSQVLSQGSEP